MAFRNNSNELKTEISQLEREIIQLSTEKLHIWSEKELFKKKILLLEDKINTINKSSFFDKKEPLAEVQSQNISENIKSEVSNAKRFLHILNEKLDSISSSFLEFEPSILQNRSSTDNENSGLKLKIKHLEEENIELSKRISELKQQKVASFEVGESSNSDDYLLKANNEIGFLLEKEDRYILEIKNLKNEIENLQTENIGNDKRNLEIQKLKHLINQGASDYENLQKKYKNLLSKNESLKENNLNIELDNVKYKAKITGLEKIIHKHDVNHGEKVAILAKTIKELETDNKNLSDEITEITTHFNILQNDIYDERGKYEALLYEANKQIKELDENYNELVAENQELHVSISLLENNLEDLENRLSETATNNRTVQSENLEKQNLELKEEINTLKEAISNSIAEIETLNNAANSHKIDNVEKSVNDEELKNITNDINNLSSLNEKFKLRIAYLEDENSIIKEHSKKLTNDKDHFETLMKSFKEQLALQEDQNISLLKENDQIKKNYFEIEEKIKEYDSVILNENDKHSLLEKRVEELNLENQQNFSLISNIKSDSPIIIQSIDKIENRLDEFEDTLILEGTRHKKIRTSLSQLQDLVFSMTEALKNQLDQDRATISSLKDKIDANNTNSKEIEPTEPTNIVPNNSDEIENLKRAIESRESTIQTLNNQLGDMETELLLNQMNSPQDFSFFISEFNKISENIRIIGFDKIADDILTLTSQMTR